MHSSHFYWSFGGAESHFYHMRSQSKKLQPLSHNYMDFPVYVLEYYHHICLCSYHQLLDQVATMLRVISTVTVYGVCKIAGTRIHFLSAVF